MSDRKFRNHKHRRLIDPRSMRVGHCFEDRHGFSVIRMVHQRNLDKPVFQITRTKTPNAPEKHRTYIARLCEALGLFCDGMKVEVPIATESTGQTITCTRISDQVLQIAMNDFFAVKDIDVYDQIILRFELVEGKAREVSIFVIEAFDKGINRELEEFFDFADQTAGFDWLKLEFLLDYLLRGSRSLAKREIDMGCTTIDITAPDCREQSLYIQWQWHDEETVEIEVIGPRFAKPTLTPSQIKKLHEFGWAMPVEGGNPNFSYTFQNTSMRQIAAFYVKSLRECFDMRPTDPIYIQPLQLLELLAPRTKTAEFLERYNKQGIHVDRDVRVTEKWLREGPTSP